MLTETLKELCALPGVSSCEDAVRDYIRAITAPYADRSYTDTLGNLIIEKKGVSPGTKKVMLAAHMDEVGLMVHTITEDGYLKFRPVGGIDRPHLCGCGHESGLWPGAVSSFRGFDCAALPISWHLAGALSVSYTHLRAHET